MSTTKTAPKPERSRRMVEISGISYPVVRTYYDVVQDLVIDVYEKTKTVPIKNGMESKEVKLLKHTLCRDPELQKEYRRGDKKIIEVNVDVE